ncbi:MAG: thiol peroxidase [Desulfobacteraceae bacterium]|nr:thiol peroxidase [Desulfobacteraceae bacterium]
MTKSLGTITLNGNPLTLIGSAVGVGDKAPDVELVDNDMKPVRISSFRGKVCVVASVPSLDTPVCDMETRRFNKDAAGLSNAVEMVTISMDLPFAQKRWCGLAGVDRVTALSDHREAAFGNAYGVLIQELRLLARAVFVIDREGVIRYRELVSEVAEEPDYASVLEAVRGLTV